MLFTGSETAVKTHNFTVRSSDALMNVPGDAVVTDVTGAVWPVYVRMQLAERPSQTLMVLSLDPVKNVTGSTTATVVTASACPTKTRKQTSFSKFHTRAVRSALPVSITCGDTEATVSTAPAWPTTVCRLFWINVGALDFPILTSDDDEVDNDGIESVGALSTPILSCDDDEINNDGMLVGKLQIDLPASIFRGAISLLERGVLHILIVPSSPAEANPPSSDTRAQIEFTLPTC